MPFNYLQTSTGTVNYQSGTNWSTLAAPTTSEDVYLANSDATITAGLLNTATLGSLNIPMTFSGEIGLASQVVQSITGITRTSTTATATKAAHGYVNGDVVIVSGANQSDYNITATISNVTTNTFDYTVANTPTTPATGTILVRKNHNLIQPATAVTIGAPSNNPGVGANGSGRIAYDAGTVQTTLTILNTSSSSSDDGLEPVRVIGSHASNKLYVLGGLVGAATTLVSETATFATISQTGGVLNGGPGLTWSALQQSGGTMNLTSGSASGTIIQTGSDSTITLTGTGTLGEVSVGGTLALNMRASSGDTVSILTLNDGATLDLTGNPAIVDVDSWVVNGSVTVRTNPANPGHFTWNTLTRNAGSRISFE